MLLKINSENPSQRKIDLVVDCLNKDGLVIYPTDSVYALCCKYNSKKALDKLNFIKKLNPKTANYSFVFDNIQQSAEFTATYDKQTFKLLNNNLPGPFTFIIEASKMLPKLLKSNKKTIGIRIPDHTVALSIVKTLNVPILTTSLNTEDDIVEYEQDPEAIYEQYKNQVDMVIDSGYGGNKASTIVNLLNNNVTIIRQGKGELRT